MKKDIQQRKMKKDISQRKKGLLIDILCLVSIFIINREATSLN